MAVDSCWRLTTESTLHCKRWDDGAVVYHEGSGDLHHLSHFGAEILATLQGGELTWQELCDELADKMSLDRDAALEQTVHITLSRFHTLGLIESVER